jgi:hypothetical protein
MHTFSTYIALFKVKKVAISEVMLKNGAGKTFLFGFEESVGSVQFALKVRIRGAQTPPLAHSQVFFSSI